ncbi:MAG: TonB-dependent receptor plug domain-containing protein [Pseudomonadales bacterium]|jgi:outer membrane receptor protein involved in Fe transport|nr:TonB-dependent receptor plug domain-containing protein [Pseudomonadales bacterium]
MKDAQKYQTTCHKWLALTIAALLYGEGVFAQQQQDVEQITVTGSRIQRDVGFTSPVPVTSVETAQLIEYAPNGTITESLSSLPQFFSNTSPRNANGSLGTFTGTSNINMRNLGANRTLVLLDGARVVPADRTSTVNTDLFPTALLQRVDVVTGGATAAYGADALAGVTNFILNRQFEGFKADFRTGVNEYGDGGNYTASFAGGFPVGDRWHVIFSVERQDLQEFERNRADEDFADWFQNYAYVQNPAWTTATAAERASGNVPQRIVKPNAVTTVNTPAGLIVAPGTALDRQTFTPDGKSIRPYQMGSLGCFTAPGVTCSIQNTIDGIESEIGVDAFDTGISSAGVERNTGFVGLQFDLSDSTQIFGHVLLGEIQSTLSGRRGNNSLGMPVLEGSSTQATIYRENAFLPASVRQAMVDANLNSIGLRKFGTVRDDSPYAGLGENIIDHITESDKYETYSLMAGVDQELPGEWNLRLHAQSGRSKRLGYAERLRLDRLFLGIDAVEVYRGTNTLVSEADRGTGEIICNVQRFNPTEAQLRASVEGKTEGWGQGAWWLKQPDSDFTPITGPVGFEDGSIEKCVPINIFGHGNASADVQNYLLEVPKERYSRVEQDFAEAVFSGPIWEGFGAGEFALALGVNWRQDSIVQYGLPFYIEAYGGPQNVPELGIRGVPTSYQSAPNLHQNSTIGYMAGDVRVKEQFAELDAPLLQTAGGQSLHTNFAYRHSQYTPGSSSNSWKVGVEAGVFDDLRLRSTFSRDMREAGFNERFEIGGAGGGTVTDPKYGEDVLTTTSTEGNPNLNTETADTLTVGFVYQPSFIPGLQASVDYYKIDQSDRIGPAGTAQQIVDECFDNGVFCDFITRSADDDRVTRIVIGQVNLAKAIVRGLDVDLVWRGELDLFSDYEEGFSLRALVGHLYENSRQSEVGAPVNDTVGGAGTPRTTGVLSANYEIGDFSIGLQERYRSRVARTNIDWVEGIDVDYGWAEIGSYMTTDLNLRYNMALDSSEWAFSFNVTNLTDRAPPIIPSMPGAQFGGSGQSVSGNYDALGRRYSLGFNVSF